MLIKKTIKHHNNTHPREDKKKWSTPTETLYSCHCCGKYNMYYSQWKIHCEHQRHKQKISEREIFDQQNESDELKIFFD